MGNTENMELTPERARKIEELLIKLYEDQYHCELVRVKVKEEASA